MAKTIDMLKEGAVRDLLTEIWEDKDFKGQFNKENFAGPSGITYMLAWKVHEQQKQIDTLLKRMDNTISEGGN